ncbi:unnamed protein product, partial [Heterosigma akashiwo]
MILQFDGSYHEGEGGAGAALYDSDGLLAWQGGQYVKVENNAEAEYEGLLLGLKAAHARNVKKIRLEGDCRMVLQQLSGKYESRKLRKHCDKALDLINTYFSEVCFSTIPREQNAHADALAKSAIDAV